MAGRVPAREDLTPEELDALRTRIKTDSSLPSARMRAANAQQVETLKKLGVHNGIEPDTSLKTSSQVDAVRAQARNPESGQFESTAGEEPAVEPATSEPTEPNAGQDAQQPETFRVPVGDKILDLTKEQLAEAWRAKQEREQVMGTAELMLKKAQANQLVADWIDSSPPQEDIDAIMQIMQGGSGSLKAPVRQAEPDMDDNDTPAPPARTARDPEVVQLKQQLAQLVAKEREREQQAALVNLERSVDQEMDKRAVFKDKNVRGLAKQAILSRAMLDDSPDVGEITAAIAVNAAALVKRPETVPDGQRAPAASKSQPGTSSEPQEKASLVRRFDGTSSIHDKILAKLNATRR